MGDAFASHLSQGLFGLVGGLLGQLGQALPVLPRDPGRERRGKTTEGKAVSCAAQPDLFSVKDSG